MWKRFSSVVAGLLAGAGVYLSLNAAAQSAQVVDFGRDIQPIFQQSCVSCHGAKMQLGGLRLDSKAMAAKAIQTGNAQERDRKSVV